MDIGRYLTQAWKLTIKNLGTMIVATLIALILGLVTLGIMFPALTVGLSAMYLKAARGHRCETSDLFAYANRTFGLFFAALGLGILVVLGFVCLIVPGIIMMAGWQFTLLAMTDGKKGLVDAMKASWTAANKGGLLMAVIFLLVMAIIGQVGTAVAGIGFVVTMPLSLGMLALAYEDLA